MPLSRIYQAIPLSADTLIQLDESASHHLARVLRAKIGDNLLVFNGKNSEYLAVITDINKKNVTVKLGESHFRQVESSLNLTLVQGISRGEKMDYIIQKAVELGVNTIVPLFTQRCTVKLDKERSTKRFEHWQGIVISACEQSGRNQIPVLKPLQQFSEWLENSHSGTNFVLDPLASETLKSRQIPHDATINLLIGPEGGLTEVEINQAASKGFQSLRLGPRILRTETAAVAALTAMQCFFGDLAN